MNDACAKTKKILLKIVGVFSSSLTWPWSGSRARKWTYIGRHTPPRNRSANAIFKTRYKLFLDRSFLLNAKSTIVNKFPTTITTASVARAQLQAMTCTEVNYISSGWVSGWVMVDLFVWFVISWSMQTLYLVLHEKQTCSDLRGSVMMVIFVPMTLSKCKNG